MELNKNKIKKCLVTGGAGFIGSNLADRLIKEGYKVVIIDNLSTGKKENINPKADFHKADICDFSKIKKFFSGVDYVFHLAAIPRIPASIEDPVSTSKINVLGTVNVFQAARDQKVKRVIFSSSSSIYGDQEKMPFTENMSPNPLSPYGLHKLIGEQFAKMFVDLYKMKIVSLRYFNVYGPRIDFDSDYGLAVGKFIRFNMLKKPLTIFGTGLQTRSFCYVDDVVEANIRAAESHKIKGGEVINIGSEKSHSINYLAELVGGEKIYLPRRVGDPLNTEADISLAKNILDWKPKVDFEDGIKATKEWFKKNIGLYKIKI
jgi:UDP-glucose 4-epimerase